MKKVMMVLAVLGAVVLSSHSAFAVVTLPDAGFEISEYVVAAITLIGGAIASVVGGYFAFGAIRAGLCWARKLFRG